MIFESLAVKAAVEQIPWRWVLIGLAAVLVGAGSLYAVHTYNQAIEARLVAERALEESQSREAQKDAVIASRTRDLERLAEYYATVETRRLQLESRTRAMLAQRSTRDDQGNITGDDGLILELNGLFSGAAGVTGTAVQARYSTTANLPR